MLKKEKANLINGLCYKCKPLYVDGFPNKKTEASNVNGLCVVCGKKEFLVAKII